MQNSFEKCNKGRGSEEWYNELCSAVEQRYKNSNNPELNQVESVSCEGDFFVVEFKDGLKSYISKMKTGKIDKVISGKNEKMTITEPVDLEDYLDQSIEKHIFFRNLANEIQEMDEVEIAELAVGDRLIITLKDGERLEPSYIFTSESKEQIKQTIIGLIKTGGKK